MFHPSRYDASETEAFGAQYMSNPQLLLCQDMRRVLEAEALNLKAKLSEPSTPSQLKYMELTRKVSRGY